MNSKEINLAEAGEEEDGILVINEDGDFVDANQRAAEIQEWDMDELLSMGMFDVVVCPSPKHGKILEKKLTEEFSDKVKVVCGDGSHIILESHSEPVTIDGERHARCDIKKVREVESTPTATTPTPFEDIGDKALEEIVQNVRVDAPGGEMPLNAIMLDIAAGHNELEQYKHGALTLHKAIDERLQEMEKRNPGSDQCKVLREVKQSAFGLYLRIQRGDKELHGERNGKYGDYFN